MRGLAAWKRWLYYAAIALPLLFLSYQIDRQQSFWVLGLYAGAFIPYALLCLRSAEFHIKETLLVFLMVRFILIFTTPGLSDDYHRFLWDGHLQKNSIHPYAYTPYEVLQQGYGGGEAGNLNKHLYNQLNSPLYYSVYPPLAQWTFYLGSLLSFGNDSLFLFILKFFQFAAELLTCLLLPLLLQLLGKASEKAVWYWANPLIIMELNANLHIESFMIAGFAAATWFLLKQKANTSAFIAGMALSFKFTPLVLYPLWLRHTDKKQAWNWMLLSGGVCIITWLLFVDQHTFRHLMNSIGLYFHTFEFNGGLYYLYKLFPNHEDVVRTVFRLAFPILTLAIALYAAWVSKPKSLLFWIYTVYGSYLLLNSTLHPWYLAPWLVIGLLYGSYTPFIWSMLIVGSYITYQTPAYIENLWLVAIEYLVVLSLFALDIRRAYRNSKTDSSQPYLI